MNEPRKRPTLYRTFRGGTRVTLPTMIKLAGALDLETDEAEKLIRDERAYHAQVLAAVAA